MAKRPVPRDLKDANVEAQLVEIELIKSLSGKIPARSRRGVMLDPRLQAFHAQVAKDFHHKSLTRVFLEEGGDGLQSHPLITARTALLRGDAKRAQKALESAHEVSRAELHLERSRAFSLQGEWHEALEEISLGLASDPTPVSQLTLLQVRCNALFELRSFGEAHASLREADDLRELFSRSTSTFYFNVLAAKIRSRVTPPEDLRALRQSLSALAHGQELTRDVALTLLRLEIDQRRLLGIPIRAHAIACHHIALAIGDHLYAGLAELDYWSTFPRAALATRRDGIAQRYSNHPMVLSLLESLSSGESFSETSRALIATGMEDGAEGDLETPVRAIVLASTVIDLETWTLVPLASQPKVLDALVALGSSPTLSREEFFARVWGNSRYSKEKHDALISNLLKRARKLAGCEIASVGGTLRLKGTLVLG